MWKLSRLPLALDIEDVYSGMPKSDSSMKTRSLHLKIRPIDLTESEECTSTATWVSPQRFWVVY